jgi:hypothetical protein
VVLGAGSVAIPNIVAAASGNNSRAVGLAIGLVAGVCLVVLFLAAWLVPQASRVARLRSRRPGALVFGVVTAMGAGRVLEARRLARSRMHTYLAVSVDSTGLSFWQGRTRLYEVASIAWPDVRDIRLGEVVTTRPVPAIVIELAGEGTETFGFAPCHEGILALGPFLDSRRTAAVVASVVALRASAVPGKT